MAPSYATASSYRPPSSTKEEKEMNYKHFWGALKKQAHGRWSQEETDVLLSEWRKLGRRDCGVQNGYLGLSYDDWCRLANAVNAYRAGAGLDSVRTYRQCKGHLRYFTEKFIELDACGAAAGEARRGSASASEGHSMKCETGKKKMRRDHDAASEAFWGHHHASASGLIGRLRVPKKPRTGPSNDSAFAGGSSWSVKEEQETKGRGREATSAARGGAATSQLFGGPVHRAMAAGSADAYMNIRLKEIEKDRTVTASAATKKEPAKGRGRGGPSMN